MSVIPGVTDEREGERERKAVEKKSNRLAKAHTTHNPKRTNHIYIYTYISSEPIGNVHRTGRYTYHIFQISDWFNIFRISGWFNIHIIYSEFRIGSIYSEFLIGSI